jgi:hypothetical protein
VREGGGWWMGCGIGTANTKIISQCCIRKVDCHFYCCLLGLKLMAWRELCTYQFDREPIPLYIFRWVSCYRSLSSCP